MIEERKINILHPGDEHAPGVYPCNGEHIALDSWHGTCFTNECEVSRTWSCWQKSCVDAWAQRHPGCHVNISKGLAYP